VKLSVLLISAIFLVSGVCHAKSAGGRGGGSGGRQQGSAARQNPVSQALSPAEEAAKSILDAMASRLDSAEGIQFDASISYPTGTATDIGLKKVTASITIERDTKLLIQTTNGGQPQDVLCSSGALFTVYDAPSNTYVRITTSPDITSLGQALQLGGKQVFPKQTPTSQDLTYALGFPMIFLGKNYDDTSVENGYSLTYSSQNGSLSDGRSVVFMTQTLYSATQGSIAATYAIDSRTGLPLSFTQTQTSLSGEKTTDISETFTNLKLLTSALPDSTYTYSPPSGATPVKVVQ
jgi:outer membrane lipoprotein-sorting protein